MISFWPESILFLVGQLPPLCGKNIGVQRRASNRPQLLLETGKFFCLGLEIEWWRLHLGAGTFRLN